MDAETSPRYHNYIPGFPVPADRQQSARIEPDPRDEMTPVGFRAKYRASGQQPLQDSSRVAYVTPKGPRQPAYQLLKPLARPWQQLRDLSELRFIAVRLPLQAFPLKSQADDQEDCVNNMTRDGSAGPAPVGGSIDGAKSLRETFTNHYGTAVGEALYQIEIEARRKTAERLRGLQVQLADVNAQLDRDVKEQRPRLVLFEQRMNDAHTAWMEACNAYEGERVRGESSVMGQRNQAAELIKEINQPDARFAVKNWGRPDWYEPEPNLPPMPDARK